MLHRSYCPAKHGTFQFSSIFEFIVLSAEYFCSLKSIRFDLSVSVQSNADHLKLWEEAKDNYLCKLLDVGLNKVPRAEKEFSSMNEQEFNTWLKENNENDDNSSEPVYTFMLVSEKQQTQESTKTLILPISLETNATVSGTASVLEEFGNSLKYYVFIPK